jgi:hypothetical protein
MDEVDVVAPGRAADRQGAGPGARLWRSGLPVFVAGVVALGVVRVYQIRDRAPLGWNDTADFLESSRAPWRSMELWAGKRPIGAPALLKVLGGDIDAYVVWQAAFAVLAWSLLAASVATAVAGRRARWGAASAVLAFSATAPVTMWERSVLSESLAISALVLVVAAGVQVARRTDGVEVATLLAALALWLMIRDSHVSVALAGGGVAAIVAAGSWLRARRRRMPEDGPHGQPSGRDGARDGTTGGVGPRDGTTAWDGARDETSGRDGLPDGTAGPDGGAAGSPPVGGGRRDGTTASDGGATASPPGRTAAWRRPLAVLGAGALLLGLLASWTSSHGERHAFPMRNVYEVRVLPYPDRVAWFADHGMPQAEVFAGPAARVPYQEPGMPPVMYVGDDDVELGPWLDWVASEGRSAFARYVLTHPSYLVTEPLRSPERTFNNALGDREFYAPLDLPRVPLVDRVLVLPTAVVLLVAALLAGWAGGRRRLTPLLVVGAVTALLSVPHGVAAWHSDGMETARHLVVPALQLHLGVLLMAVGTAWGAPERHAGAGAGARTAGDGPGG